ncbi:Ldh family oxidoreductase [Algicola sagamiensis]|uniref:Ldh family oxidoreductase n=1 Tax=Algicola sagamiensis TaxID=163869 RepID=UPI00036BE9AA|nr:Ldh family oxidoreductase [Algicola sagamiensis]
MKDFLVEFNQLKQFIEKVFLNEGVAQCLAKQAAETLVYADMAGLDTHGVLNLISIYVNGIRSGEIYPHAEMSVIQDTAATVSLNANRMLGLNAGQKAIELAIEKAKKFGVGIACVRNSTHFGAAGYYSQFALRDNMLAISMTNLGSKPVAHVMGSQRPVIGTNPIALAAPVNNMPDFVLDMSTSVCASGKIKQAKAKQSEVSAHWLYDAQGDPVTDADAYFANHAFLPGLGGWEKSSGGHKGFGLNLMVEILSGVLSGADLPTTAQQGKQNEVGHFFLAINIGNFLPPALFKQRMAQMLDGYLSEPTFDGFDSLQYAGLPDAHLRTQREAGGIPIPCVVLEELNGYALENNIEQLEVI